METIEETSRKTPQEAQSSNTVTFGDNPVTIDSIVDIALGNKKVGLSKDPAFTDNITKGVQFLDRLLEEDGTIYGVTTGYGDSCTVAVPDSLIEELPINLTRFHGCGMGKPLSHELSIATLATRLASLSRGYSGVSLELLEQFETLINHGIAPVIPEEGSVGASGDLTPLSYVAAVLMGEREVTYQGKQIDTAEVYQTLGISGITLRPKEGLAVMNGTAVMTAISCMAYSRAEYLSRLAARITAMASIVLKGNSNHFDKLLFEAKPHPGQNEIATWIRHDINHIEHPRNSSRLQDRYSIRCAPHVIGVLRDALPWMKSSIEIELNSANDNPIIDAQGEHVLHGGHFYGGHIAFAMDSMKNCVANVADLLDRQMALLMDTKFNNGLPANLSGSGEARRMINHGFKAVQIGTSAWTAEALKNTMPASVFSRSTECHNQDKVSMGTISARDSLRVLELTEQVAAAELLAVNQALAIRLRSGEIAANTLSKAIVSMHEQVLGQFEFLEEDRPLESDLRNMLKLIQSRHWDLYD